MAQSTLAELEVFVRYSVEAEACDEALAFVRGYAAHRIGLLVLSEFYRNLPEAREEAVIRLTKLVEQQGVMLFVASTVHHHYLILVADDNAQLLGEFLEDDLEEEVLAHFGCRDMADFRKKYSNLSGLPEYRGEMVEAGNNCPVCGVAVGEFHFLGCPVEICPWCDGQFNRCNCRFEQLQIKEFTDEEDLDALADLLDSKGRIPYAVEQKPGYPGSSAGLDKDVND